MSTKKTTAYFTEETSVVDENGRVRSKTTKSKARIEREPDYIKLYLQDITYLSDMPKSYGNILYELFKYVSYANDEDGLIVAVNAYIKQNIANTLDITVEHVSNALSKMCKGDVLELIARGTYRLNPYLFGKGDWATIKQLRLNVNYTLEGRTFKTNIEYKDAGGKYGIHKSVPEVYETPEQIELANQYSAKSVSDWQRYCSPQTPQGAYPDKDENGKGSVNDTDELPELERMNA